MSKTYIIAEIGINHNGDFNTALKLIDAAKDCGADAVKFQTFWCFPDLKQYEFTKKQWGVLKDHAHLNEIDWFSTPFDFEAIDFLNEIGMTTWKIPSGMVTNFAYLGKIQSTNPEWIILSTGMSTGEEVWKALWKLSDGVPSSFSELITVLHCTTAYPAPINEINILAMLTLKGWLCHNVGLSDHTLGIEIPIAAVALGAEVIEKHITLDRNQDGPDHKASLEPAGFKEMVRCIRNVEVAMGDGEKKPTPTELKHRDEIRKRMGAV